MLSKEEGERVPNGRYGVFKVTAIRTHIVVFQVLWSIQGVGKDRETCIQVVVARRVPTPSHISCQSTEETY